MGIRFYLSRYFCPDISQAAKRRLEQLLNLKKRKKSGNTVSGLVVESMDSCGPEMRRTTYFVVGKACWENQRRTTFNENFKQRISVAIQCGNAACVLGTLTETRGLVVVFYVIFD